MMRHPQSHVIDAYWAERFGCSPDVFHRPGVNLVIREDADPTRIAVLEMGDSTILRAAEKHADILTAWSNNRKADDPRTAEAVSHAFPAYQWNVSPSEKVLYLNPDEFRPDPKPGVRQLTEADSDDLTEMHRGCTSEEQKSGEVNIDHPAIFGAYADGRLVAAASFIDQDDRISDVGVLVHRDFRQKGYGRAAVSALCEWGLGNGRIVQYWRLCKNTASARIADSLGFSEYGRFQVLFPNVSAFT